MADSLSAATSVDTENYAFSDLLRLAASEQYDALQKTFLANGGEERPTLPHLIIDNKLLLQLYTLKETNGKSWEQLESWFAQIKEGFTVRPRVEKVLRKLNDHKDLDITVFLSQTLDMDFISSTLSSFGVTKKTINFPPEVPTIQSDGVPNVFVIDFYKFCILKSTDKKTIELLFKWLRLYYFSLEKSSLKKKVACILRRDKKLKSSKHRHPDLYDNFLNTIFSVSEEPKKLKVKPLPSFNEITVVNLKLKNALKDLKRVTKNVEELIIEKDHLLNKLLDKDKEISVLWDKLRDSEKKRCRNKSVKRLTKR